MEQTRFTNGYITYTDRLFSEHCRNEVYQDGNGWLGTSYLLGYLESNTPFSYEGNGFLETWDTSVCHYLIFKL